AVEASINLNLGDGAHTDTESKRSDAKQISLESRRRKRRGAQKVETAFEEHETRGDCLRILGDHRPRLRRRLNREGQTDRRGDRCSGKPGCHGPSLVVQNKRRLSRRIVTGPSFTSSTSMWAWKTPVSTGPSARNRSSKASNVDRAAA